jgi:hypothetical protein
MKKGDRVSTALSLFGWGCGGDINGIGKQIIWK